MADYWKSNPRKWCDFCKCWIADNKVSIQFHEKGIKHQQAVEQHIRQARARGTQKLQEQEYVKQQLEAINKKALAALGKDIEQDATLVQDSQYQAAVSAARQAVPPPVPIAAPPPPPPPTSEKPSEDKAPKAAPKPPEVDSATGLGKWQTVEVNEEEQEAKKEEQRRIEMKRDRNEVKSEKRQKEKVVEFKTKEVGSLAGDDGEVAVFKKKRTAAKVRQVRQRLDSD